jgi:hypothetical protein
MGRRTLVTISSTVAAALAVSGAVGTPSSLARTQQYGFCPPAKHLVGSTTKWHRHQLAPGVKLETAHVGHGRNRLTVNVVRAQLGRRTVQVRPLHHALTTRRPLSHLARRHHLVAATNGMYFNYAFGAPTVPFISTTGAMVLSRHHAMVAGIGTNGRAQDGHAWFTGRVTSSKGGHRLRAINEVAPPRGLSLYTAAWGSTKVPLPLHARTRLVRNGRFGPIGTQRRVRGGHGALLLATTAASVSWLHSVRRHGPASLSYRAKTDAHHRFSQAYGVGTQVVAAGHHIRTGLYCRRSEILAARTDFAWSNHGKHLILATVKSPYGSSNYGVDENQMSQVMVALGADRAYALDGGGSTELVVRLHGQYKLTIRTRQHGGAERRIPIGVGVYSLPKSQVAKHHKHGHHHKQSAPPPHKKHHKHGLLGVLPPIP